MGANVYQCVIAMGRSGAQVLQPANVDYESSLTNNFKTVFSNMCLGISIDVESYHYLGT